MGRKPGVPDYSDELKCEAVQAYKAECTTDELAYFEKHARPLLRRGGSHSADRSTMQRAKDRLSSRTWKDPADATRLEQMDLVAFRQLVCRHAEGVQAFGMRYHRTRTTPPSPLSQSEYEDAAKLLGTPRTIDGHYKYHRSVEECYVECSRFHELADRSKLKLSTFANQLLTLCPHILRKGVLDTKEILTDSARQSRSEASEVWGGRQVWRVSKHAGPLGGGLRRGKRDVYWGCVSPTAHTKRWPYYNNYTFMMDAKTFNTGTPVESTDYVGYYRVDELFPPEETRAPDPVGTILQLMFYIVVHPVLGIVSGPDVMYTGSRSSKSKKKRHLEQFKCWCGFEPGLHRHALFLPVMLSHIMQAFQNGWFTVQVR